MKQLATVVLVTAASIATAAELECLVEPRQVVELKAPVDGLISRITVDRGDFVKKDQVLVELDAGVDRSRLDLARYKSAMDSNIKAAALRAEFSSKKLDRENGLYQRNFVSAHERDEAETGKSLAEAELLEAKDNKKLAQLEVHNYEELLRLKTLRSPFKGVVMERARHPGEVTVGGNDTKPILKLAEVDPLYVEVMAPASALGKVAVGDKITVALDEPVGQQVTARVQVIDPVIDAASGTLGIRLELPNPNNRIPPGIHCRADFTSVADSGRNGLGSLSGMGR